MSGQCRTNQYLKAAKTSVRDGLLTVTPGDDAVFVGEGFAIETVFSVANAENFNLVFDPTSLGDKRLTVFPTRWATSNGTAIINLGTCSDYSGGTEVVSLNKHYNFDSAESVVTRGATLTDHVVGPTNILVGTATQGANLGGGTNTGGGGISILDTSLIYVFSFTAAADLSLGTYIQWFEVDGGSEIGC